MEVIDIIIGFLFFQFDITLLKKRALPIFERVFCIPRWQIGIIVFYLLLALLRMGDGGLIIVKIVFIMAFVIYLLLRSQFIRLVKASPENAMVVDETLELALSTFSIMALWVLGMIGISLFSETVSAVLHKPKNDLVNLLIFSEISSVLLIVLVYRAVRRRKNLNLFDVLGLETKGLGGFKIWVLPAVFALGYAIVTSLILDARPIQPMTPLQDLLNSTSSVGALILFVGTAILTAPFFEEIIFRGFFFYVIKPYKGVIFAVIFVALIFGLLHVDQYWGDWEAIAVVGLFGLSLTLLRAWTGSCVPGMIAHYIYNTSLTVIPLMMVIFSNPLYFDYQMNYYRLTETQKEEKLMQSIAKYPKFTNSYNDLAWLYSEEEIKLDRALELINKALDLEPGNYAFLDTKAEVLFKMRRASEAITIEEELLKKHPDDSYLKEQLKKFQSVFVESISTDI